MHGETVKLVGAQYCLRFYFGRLYTLKKLASLL